MNSLPDMIAMPIYYRTAQPRSCVVDEFIHDIGVINKEPSNLSLYLEGNYVAESATVDGITIKLSLHGFLLHDGDVKATAFFISTTTTFYFLSAEAETISIPESDSEEVEQVSVMTSIGLTRAHLFNRFQFARGWEDYILPMVSFQKFISKKKSIKREIASVNRSRNLSEEVIRPTDDLT